MLRRIPVLMAFVLGACSPGAAPVSRASNDPSNPSAPEGMNPAVAVTEPHAHAATVYACPMHPEVTSDKPDQTCPKCGMKLVPKQP